MSILTAEALEAMSVAQIEALVRVLPDDAWEVWSLLEKDRRLGVRRIAVQRRRDLRCQEEERARRARLLEFERRLWEQGLERVAGVDEVGRGCLAGPVVAAAVILPRGAFIEGLDDSKKLSPEKRERLRDEIAAQALAIGLGQVEAEEIDRINVLQASLKAMRLALDGLAVEPQQVLVDGKQRPGSRFPELPIVDGDARSLSVAAASVVAKVHRDRLMVESDARYPGYGFAVHKGYGSAYHLAMLRARGPCPLHRRSFGPVAALVEAPQTELFQTLAAGLRECRSRAELEPLGRFLEERIGELEEREGEQLRRLYRKRRQVLEDTGQQGEALAAEYLIGRGYAVLARGYRGGGGEIDIVARSRSELIFVEVKTSRAGGLGVPEERVQNIKRNRLVRAARHYLAQHLGEPLDCRFDVIAVILSERGHQIEHLKDAFRP